MGGTERLLKRYQVGCALFLLCFGTFICWEARKLDMGRVVKPGPGFFPFWLGLALIIVSLALVFQFSREKTDPSISSQDLWKGLRWEKILFSLVALTLYALFLESLGYILATILLMVFFFRAIEPQRWMVAVFGSVITSFITYALFKSWLQVQLPAGLWGM
jgi:putative tricarboxylic transport membrane protein